MTEEWSFSLGVCFIVPGPAGPLLKQYAEFIHSMSREISVCMWFFQQDSLSMVVRCDHSFIVLFRAHWHNLLYSSNDLGIFSYGRSHRTTSTSHTIYLVIPKRELTLDIRDTRRCTFYRLQKFTVLGCSSRINSGKCGPSLQLFWLMHHCNNMSNTLVKIRLTQGAPLGKKALDPWRLRYGSNFQGKANPVVCSHFPHMWLEQFGWHF